jgi:hypothetical protein
MHCERLLMPLRAKVDESITHMGATIVDSLGFLHILGLKDELAAAKEWVLTELKATKDVEVSVFESTIRILGGLLSVHALTQDHEYIAPAEQLGNSLLKAFKADHKLPCKFVHLRTGKCSKREAGMTSLTAAGTLLMEFRQLSKATGNPAFELAARDAERAIIARASRTHPRWLLPRLLSTKDAQPHQSEVNVDGGSDSYYEYVAKLWLQGGRTEHELQQVFNGTVNALVKHCLVETPHFAVMGSVSWNDLQLHGDAQGQVKASGTHLGCFFPGTLALFGTQSGDAARVNDPPPLHTHTHTHTHSDTRCPSPLLLPPPPPPAPPPPPPSPHQQVINSNRTATTTKIATTQYSSNCSTCNTQHHHGSETRLRTFTHSFLSTCFRKLIAEDPVCAHSCSQSIPIGP